MGYLTLIKYAVIVAWLSAVVFAIHQNGRKVERTEWLQKEIEQREQLALELEVAMQRVTDLKEQHQDNLMRSLNERETEINRLNNDLANAKRLHIRTKSAACDANAVPGKAEGPGLPDGAVETELPAEIERSLRELAGEAERELINCNALKNIVAPHIEVIQ